MDAQGLPANDGGENLYWVRAGSNSAGIVVATVWMMCKPRQFEKYSHLYASCYWDSLVAHPKFFGLWFPTLARALAIRILDKLVQELQERPRPVVFATFSGGLKACLYKILEVIDASVAADSASTKYRIVRDCYAGQIHDSSPIDFVSRNGARFLTHPIILGTKKRSGQLTRAAYATARALDFMFLSKFEIQRAEMWAAVDKSGEWGPILLFCSKDDDLAPYDVIQDFSSRLSKHGHQITVIMWEESTHVAHFRRHPDEYRSAIFTFLSAASVSTSTCTPAHDQDSSRTLGRVDSDKTIRRSSTLSGMFSTGRRNLTHRRPLLNELPITSFMSETSPNDDRMTFWIPARM